MISCNSSLASSTPATSLKVTFFCWVESNRARLFPNDSALLPPLCIWRMKKIQKPRRMIMGRPWPTQVIHVLPELSLMVRLTFFSCSVL